MRAGHSLKLRRVSNAVAAGTDDTTTCAAVDMEGFDGCMFVAAFGTITASAVTTLKVSQCDTAAGSYADLLGSSVAVADSSSNKLAWVDIYRPREQFLKAAVTRATANAVIDGVFAILYKAGHEPTTHDSATVATGEVHDSPIEGTA